MDKKQPRIVIVGGGPSGLLTAHYLQKNGYRDVWVLEKLGRIGGLADSITFNNRSFDLGANYITPAYREIRKLAKELGATTYAERPFIAMRLPLDDMQHGKAELGSIVAGMRLRKDGKSKVPLLSFAWANVRYIWKRHKLRKLLDGPTLAGAEKNEEMSIPFIDWLERNKLMELYGVFLLPVNLMGYGTVETTPALYPLKFMTLKTYIPMLIKETPVIGNVSRWPRRFTDGFQRFFDRLSWRLNVRLNISISSIRRDEHGVHIRYEQHEQILDRVRSHAREMRADRLILACPLTSDVVHDQLSLDIAPGSSEDELLSKVQSLSYCMTTRHVRGENFDGKDPLAACYPQPEIFTVKKGVPPDESKPAYPWGVAKQWNDSDFVQFYTRIAFEDFHDATEADVETLVERGVEDVVRVMGGTLVAPDESWSTYNRFPYFQHVDCEAIRGGWFTKLEEQQGVNNTYYVGGATNFELVEPIAEYAKNLVARHFPPVRD